MSSTTFVFNITELREYLDIQIDKVLPGISSSKKTDIINCIVSETKLKQKVVPFQSESLAYLRVNNLIHQFNHIL